MIAKSNGTQTKPGRHKLPGVLADRIQSEVNAANAKIDQINAECRKTLSLLIAGYSASLDPAKTYSLSNDLKYLDEYGDSAG